MYIDTNIIHKEKKAHAAVRVRIGTAVSYNTIERATSLSRSRASCECKINKKDSNAK